jgi:hypothetical protein
MVPHKRRSSKLAPLQEKRRRSEPNKDDHSFSTSDEEDDSSFHPVEEIKYHGWGKKETNRSENVTKLIEGIEENIRDGLSLDSCTKISTDCDAFSLLVIIENEEKLSPETKERIIHLLSIFGTPFTSITVPKAPVAMHTNLRTRKDAMFGSQHVKMTSEINLVEDKCLLVKNEALIIDTPVKIATHQKCRDSLVNGFNKKQFPVELSLNKGICILPNKTRALPNYFESLDIILDNCYDPESKKHIIHIGDLGTRHPVKTTSSHCYLQEMFERIQKLRELKTVMVEVCQLDIAFNVKLGNKLITWHPAKKYKKENSSSFFKHLNATVFPLHNVASEGDFPTDKEQKGTIQFKHHKKWGDKDESIDLAEEEEEHKSILSQIYQKQEKEEVGAQLQEEEGTRMQEEEVDDSTILSNIYDLHSVKFYTTVIHSLPTQTQYKFPKDGRDFDQLPKYNIRRIKDLVSTIMDFGFKAITQIQNHGVLGRIEFSVRPTSHSQDLRLNGHLVDFLSIMFHSSIGIRRKELVAFEYLDHEIVTETIFALAKSIKGALVCRDSTPFNVFWEKHPNRCVWLKAMISLLLTLSGYAHLCKTKLVREWMKTEGIIYDPIGVKKKIQCGNLLQNESVQLVQQNQDDNHVWATVKSILEEINVSLQGIEQMQNLIKRHTSVISTFRNLLLEDNLKIAEHMEGKIMCAIKNLIQESESDNCDQNLLHQHQDYQESRCENQELNNQDLYDEFLDSVHDSPNSSFVPACDNAIALITQQRPNLCPKVKSMMNQPTQDPIESALSILAEFTDLISPGEPGFMNRMCNFIGELFPNTLLKNYSHGNDLLYVDLQQAAAILGLDIKDLGNTEIVMKLCQHSLFPCINTKFDLSLFQKEVIESRQRVLLSLQNHVRVSTLQSDLPGYNLIRRHGENGDVCVYIPKTETVTKVVEIDTVDSEFLYENNVDSEILYEKKLTYTSMLTALDKLFNDGDTPSIIQSILDSRLKHTQDLCDKFIVSSNGMNHPHFHHYLTVESLIEAICEENGEKIDPPQIIQIILACAAYHRQKNIAYTDIPNAKFILFHYNLHTDKVMTISRQFPQGGIVLPKVECIHVEKKASDEVQVGHWVLSDAQKQCCHLKDDRRQEIHNITTGHPHLGPNQRLPRKTVSFGKVVMSALRSFDPGNSLLHDDVIDIICNLVNEAAFIRCTLNEMLDHSLISFLKNVGVVSWDDIATLLPIYQRGINVGNIMENTTEKFTHTIVVASITCFRYNLCIAIYSETPSNDSETRFIYLHPYTRKVHLVVENGYKFLKDHPQFIYVRFVKKEFHYWDADEKHRLQTSRKDFFWLLSQTSYLDDTNKDKVLEHFRKQHSMLIIDSNQTEELQNQKLHDLYQPIIIPITITNNSGKMMEHVLLVVYPLNSRGVFDVGLICSDKVKMNHPDIEEEVHTVMLSLLENSTHKEYKLHMMHFRRTQLCSAHLLVLHIYAAKDTQTPKNLFNIVGKLQRTDRIDDLCKDWIGKIMLHYRSNGTIPLSVNNWVDDLIRPEGLSS